MTISDLQWARAAAPQLSEAASFSIEDSVYALLGENGGLGPTQGDSSPFFDETARKNVGAAGAISVDVLGSTAATMAVQRDVSGNRVLGLTPAVLLVPVASHLKAKTIVSSAVDSAAPVSGAANPVRDIVRDVVAGPQLSGARGYLFADPLTYPAIVVGFIGGNEAPTVESASPIEVDGLQIRVRIDYGVGATDPRPAVTARRSTC